MNLYPLSMKLYQLGMISPCIKGASVTGYCIDPFYVLGCRIDLQKNFGKKRWVELELCLWADVCVKSAATKRTSVLVKNKSIQYSGLQELDTLPLNVQSSDIFFHFWIFRSSKRTLTDTESSLLYWIFHCMNLFYPEVITNVNF